MLKTCLDLPLPPLEAMSLLRLTVLLSLVDFSTTSWSGYWKGSEYGIDGVMSHSDSSLELHADGTGTYTVQAGIARGCVRVDETNMWGFGWWYGTCDDIPFHCTFDRDEAAFCTFFWCSSSQGYYFRGSKSESHPNTTLMV